jgi:hypothetical protein
MAQVSYDIAVHLYYPHAYISYGPALFDDSSGDGDADTEPDGMSGRPVAQRLRLQWCQERRLDQVIERVSIGTDAEPEFTVVVRHGQRVDPQLIETTELVPLASTDAGRLDDRAGDGIAVLVNDAPANDAFRLVAVEVVRLERDRNSARIGHDVRRSVGRREPAGNHEQPKPERGVEFL